MRDLLGRRHVAPDERSRCMSAVPARISLNWVVASMITLTVMPSTYGSGWPSAPFIQ